MLYLDFLHIDDFGAHLKDKGINQAFVTMSDRDAESSEDIKFHDVTFSARVEDYIALCTFSFHSKGEMSLEGERAFVEQQAEMLQERLSRFGITVIKGRWTDETPQRLRGETR